MTENYRIVVATPVYGGQVTTTYMASILNLWRVAHAMSNVEMEIIQHGSDALITRARAHLVTQFLDDPSATHLLFVDADIGFAPEAVFRLLASGLDVVGGAYPLKRINWEKAKRAITARAPNIPAASLDYVLAVEDPHLINVVNGFAMARYVGTGFLMIRRRALAKMCAHKAYAPLQFFRDHTVDGELAGSPNRFALFDPIIDPATGTYLSEDFAFCKRWTDIGGEVWADLKSRLDHVGPSVFHGDISSCIGRQSSNFLSSTGGVGAVPGCTAPTSSLVGESNRPLKYGAINDHRAN